jgi:tight adherence protein C
VELLIAVFLALSVGSFVVFFAYVLPTRSSAARARIAELGIVDGVQTAAAYGRTQRGRLKDLVLAIGERADKGGAESSEIRRRLIMAGYRDNSALPAFLGIRIGAAVGLGLYGFIIGSASSAGGLGLGLFVAAVGAGLGWVVPNFMLSIKVTRRQRELRRALPDALDLLVICVEAGLGLNQAFIRVASEMRHVSFDLATELAQVNLEVRAGTPRDQALTALGERTGVEDLRALATMLIQTERFGTSIADSLRVHADTMRVKRQQRVEEESAKTTIKLVFPLALCVFPALFMVILGPVLISIYQSLQTL